MVEVGEVQVFPDLLHSCAGVIEDVGDGAKESGRCRAIPVLITGTWVSCGYKVWGSSQ